MPPLGLLWIASVLRECGHDCHLYDHGIVWNDFRRLREVIRSFKPQAIGISALAFEAEAAHAMAKVCKEEARDTPVVIGGPYPTSFPSRCLSDRNIDFVVLGEGEETAKELFGALVRGGDPYSVAGIAYRKNGEVVLAKPRPPIANLDDLPLPAWDLLNFSFYEKHRSMSTMGIRRYAAISTSRGCPFKCIYCHNTHGKRFRPRSPEHVLKELIFLKNRYGVREFEIVDDIFNFNDARFQDILEGVIDSRLDASLHFPNGIRTDWLDERRIKLMKKAGTVSVAMILESATPRIQKLMKKGLNIEKVRENMEIGVKEGLFVCGGFMVGFPTETYEEAKATVDFAVQSSIHQAYFFLVTPFEGTPLFEMTKAIIAKRRLLDQPLFELDFFRGNYNLSAMSDEQLFTLHREAYRRFYADPKRMIRIALRHPRPLFLPRLALRAFAKALPRKRGNIQDPLRKLLGYERPFP
jgi:radical SAM superfamily enzyme YgiQ (UPF0313 family)